MIRLILRYVTVTGLVLLLNGLHGIQKATGQDRINGVALESPVKPTQADYMEPLKRINAGWVAIVPYVFMEGNKPSIYKETSENYWGDTRKGMMNSIKLAKKHHLKVMLKPHIWVKGQGWAGDLQMSKKEWRQWEAEYSSFVLDLAVVADSLGVEMVCIGTEIKTSVQRKPEFWRILIGKIRNRYKGKLTYAANWDNFQNVPFWDELDYIGVDAYFPLSPKKTPEVDELVKSWRSREKQLDRWSEKVRRPVIFTEMGYRSIDKTAWKQWESEYIPDTVSVNLAAQINAFTALFQSVWKEDWFAGGFIWEWHANDAISGGTRHSNYTPQNKPVEAVIAKWYR